MILTHSIRGRKRKWNCLQERNREPSEGNPGPHPSSTSSGERLGCRDEEPEKKEQDQATCMSQECPCHIYSIITWTVYSACKLNKQGDNIQPWRTLFPIWNQSIVSRPVLTVASWPDYRFCRRQGKWSGIPISWRIFHSLLWSTQNFGVVDKAEIDVFLEFSCFFYDPKDVGHLISGSSAFLNLAWISEHSRFTYCWGLAWRILSVTLLACEMSTNVQ